MTTGTKMSRQEIIDRADNNDRMGLQDAAAYVVFRYALEHGWITQREHDAAKAHYGKLWNYTGD
jgi:hypothetical protein